MSDDSDFISVFPSLAWLAVGIVRRPVLHRWPGLGHARWWRPRWPWGVCDGDPRRLLWSGLGRAWWRLPQRLLWFGEEAARGFSLNFCGSHHNLTLNLTLAINKWNGSSYIFLDHICHYIFHTFGAKLE
jgi:hypothetical protein